MAVVKDLIKQYYLPEIGEADVRIRNITLGTNAERILENNPLRYQYIIQNLSANDIYVNYASDVSADNGLIIPSRGFFSSVWTDDLTITTYELFGIASAGGSNLLIIEYLLL